jgi:hypothetical protein
MCLFLLFAAVLFFRSLLSLYVEYRYAAVLLTVVINHVCVGPLDCVRRPRRLSEHGVWNPKYSSLLSADVEAREQELT